MSASREAYIFHVLTIVVASDLAARIAGLDEDARRRGFLVALNVQRLACRNHLLDVHVAFIQGDLGVAIDHVDQGEGAEQKLFARLAAFVGDWLTNLLDMKLRLSDSFAYHKLEVGHGCICHLAARSPFNKFSSRSISVCA